MGCDIRVSIVGGAGRVGLPLALVLAKNGFKIQIIDLDYKKIELIKNCVMPFSENGAQEILKNLPLGCLNASSTLEHIEGTDYCILIVGTPVSVDGKPSSDDLLHLISDMLPYLFNTKVLILRSTVYPGITQEIKEFLAKNDCHIEVAFCPERIVEGDAIHEIKTLPQIIGVETDQAFKCASTLFDSISPEIIRTNFREAEIMKLFANSFRYLQFAIANEFFEICVKNNINWENVWGALKQNYPRMASLPKPGLAAGPCLVKDTQQLDYYVSGNFRLGKMALEVNEKLPDFIFEFLRGKTEIKDKVIGILGMTFKGNIDDFRDSLSFRLKKIFETNSRMVYCSDAILQKSYFVSSAVLIEKSDIIIIAAPHDDYKNLIISKPLIDIWRISNNESLM